MLTSKIVTEIIENHSVLLSVGPRITSSNCKNEDSAKSDCFCDFYAFLKMRGCENHVIFVKEVPVPKNVGNL